MFYSVRASYCRTHLMALDSETITRDIGGITQTTQVGVREISDGFFWIHQVHSRPDLREEYGAYGPDWYLPGHEVHTIQNAYLFVGEETLLFDTLDPVAKEMIVDRVSEVLGDDSLDYLAVTHPEAPHAGNAFAIRDAYPEATLLAPDHGTAHGLYHLGDATKVRPGDRLDLGDLTLEFVEPTFLDHALHIWARELTTDTLFTVDWLSHFIMEGEQLKFADEVRTEISHHRLLQFHGNVLGWFQYVDPEKTNAAIEKLVETYDPSMLVQSHGLPVRENVPQHLRKMKTVIDHIAATGGLKTL